MKVYADTSVFGGVFDQEFSGPSRQFFDEVDAERFILLPLPLLQQRLNRRLIKSGHFLPDILNQPLLWMSVKRPWSFE